MADSHDRQRALWDAEHARPHMLLPMDSHEPSSGVRLFWDWMKMHHVSSPLHGLEMGCGKGRNSIWLAQQGCSMTAFDFSDAAITEAKNRAGKVSKQIEFLLHDATVRWPFPDRSFDFGVDCFASSDIETSEGRVFARDEFARVLKPGSYLFVYALGASSVFQGKMIHESPGPENNSFLHPSGKFEKAYDEQELLDFYSGFHLREKKITHGETEFYGKMYATENYWCVFQLP